MIRAILADDHRIVIDGLKHVLSHEGDIEIVGIAGSGEELLGILDGGKGADILILDMSMPGRSGIDLIEYIRRNRNSLPILVLSMYPEAIYGIRALRAGANGYLTKDSDASQLLHAIRRVAAGYRFASETLMQQIMSESLETPARADDLLSDREIMVLQLLASGSSVTDIANHLNLSVKTISTHKSNIQGKLGLNGTAQLTRYAIARNMVTTIS